MVSIRNIKPKHKFISYVPFLPNRRGWGSLWSTSPAGGSDPRLELLGAFLAFQPVKPGGLELQLGIELLEAGSG